MGLLKSIGGFAQNVIAPFANPSMAGDMITGGAVSNAKSVSDTNNAQIQLAREQTQFQERMSSTAYQRAMADMKTAGLNPMLAYEQGGASVPTGAMAQLNAPRTGDIGKGLNDKGKEVASAMMGSVGTKNTESQTNLNTVNAEKSEAEAEKATASAKESRANTENVNQETERAKYDTRTAKNRAKESDLDLDIAKARKPLDKKLAPVDAVTERVGNIGSAAANLIRGLFGGKGSAKKINDSTIQRGPGRFNSRGGIN